MFNAEFLRFLSPALLGHRAWSPIPLGVAINLQNSRVLELAFSQGYPTLVFTYESHVIKHYFCAWEFSLFSCELSSALTFIVVLPSSDCFVGLFQNI